MLILWSLHARQDLLEILAYFTSLEDVETGKSIVSRIILSVDRLAEYPLSGRQGRIAGTREILVRTLPYLLVYRNSPQSVEIARVFHTSKLFPESLER